MYPDARLAIIEDTCTKRVLLPSGQVIATNKHVVMEYELRDATESCQEWMVIRGSHSFLVLPNRTYDVILGAPWLTRYRVNMDFSTRRLLAHEGPSLSATDLGKSVPMGGRLIYWYPPGEQAGETNESTGTSQKRRVPPRQVGTATPGIPQRAPTGIGAGTLSTRDASSGRAASTTRHCKRCVPPREVGTATPSRAERAPTVTGAETLPSA